MLFLYTNMYILTRSRINHWIENWFSLKIRETVAVYENTQFDSKPQKKQLHKKNPSPPGLTFTASSKSNFKTAKYNNLLASDAVFVNQLNLFFSITVDQHPSIPRQVCRGRKLLPGMCWANVRVLSRENFTYIDRSLSGKIQQVSGNDFVSIELISCRESVLNKQYKSVKRVQQVNSIDPNRNYLQFLNRRML